MIASRLFLLLALAVIGAQGQMIYTSADGQFTFSGHMTGVFDTPKDKTTPMHVLLHGAPVRGESPTNGLTATAREMELTWLKVDAKTTEIRQGRLEGDADIVFDGGAAQAAKVEQARKLNKPELPQPKEISRFEAKSELFSYTGTVATGTLTMPDPWTMQQVTHGAGVREEDGHPVPFTFDQTFDASGTKGTMSVVAGKDGALDQPSTGHLNGPVHFKLVRHEKAVGAAEISTTTYTGVADSVDIDMTTSPGTVAAHGHVVVDAVRPEGRKVHFEEDEFTVDLDPQMNPLGFRFSGHPGLTTAKANGKGGSR